MSVADIKCKMALNKNINILDSCAHQHDIPSQKLEKGELKLLPLHRCQHADVWKKNEVTVVIWLLKPAHLPTFHVSEHQPYHILIILPNKISNQRCIESNMRDHFTGLVCK